VTEVEKNILREGGARVSKLVAVAIYDILNILLGNHHDKWGVDNVDYATTNQSIMIQLITVITDPHTLYIPPSSYREVANLYLVKDLISLDQS
jgi:hypothetical protein